MEHNIKPVSLVMSAMERIARSVRPGMRGAIKRTTGRELVHLPSGEWLVVPRNGHSAQLPVRATYNLTLPLKIDYDFHFCDAGTLELCLRREAGPALFTISRPVKMPCSWALAYDSGFALNGDSITAVNGATLEAGGWLVSELTFTSAHGQKLTRSLRHRFNPCSQEIGPEYYNGSNYGDYEREAADYGVRILDLLLRHSSIHSLLDIGCATGILLDHAKSRGIHVFGVDVSDWAVEHANQRLGEEACRVLDIDHAQPSDFDTQYDAIVLHNVLEHVRDPGKLVALASSVVKPGGLVYCLTLNADSLMHAMLAKDWAGYSDYSHHSPWLTASWVRDAFQRAGFEFLEFQVPEWLWNERTDAPFIDLSWLMTRSHARQILRDGWGDMVELVARRRVEPE